MEETAHKDEETTHPVEKTYTADSYNFADMQG